MLAEPGQQDAVYNCCFSSELLRRELAWTREDPLLGFLLWVGPYSSPGRGVLTISLDPLMLARCLVNLDGLSSTTYRKRFATRSAQPRYPADPVAAAS